MPAIKSKQDTSVTSADKSVSFNAVSEEMQRDIERAEKARSKLRKAASSITAQGLRTDPRKRLRQELVPESIATYKNATRQGRPVRVVENEAAQDVCFIRDEKQDYRRKLNDGWEPVIEDGEIVKDGADIMMKRPSEFGKVERTAFERSSQARLEASNAKAAGKEHGVEVTEATFTKGVSLD